jgi:glyceraldehyde-3-phosphate dehydrogenase/erythrose-4-phosphate dehydrogenase
MVSQSGASNLTSDWRRIRAMSINPIEITNGHSILIRYICSSLVLGSKLQYRGGGALFA